jgi:N-acetylneuraminate synthase
MKTIFEKSIVIARPVAAGSMLEKADLAFKKPGDGISAARYRDILGRKVKETLTVNHKLTEDDLQ